MSYSRYKSHEAETLQDVILLNCEKFADKTALHWLNEECNVTEQYTYAEIKERTREIAAGLQLLLGERTKTGVDARERAVLCYPPGLEFILTFIASLRAGIIPVPVSTPNIIQSQYTAETLFHIIHDSGASFVLTSKEFYYDNAMLEIISTSPVPWHCEVTTELVDHRGATTDAVCDMSLDDIAFLLYTSGSTGLPKGVMISHENILHNNRLTQAYTDTNSSMIEISFLPHFQDMGLIASYLHTLCVGGKGYFMSPSMFTHDPMLWIRAFSKFKGTHGKAPNFAFDFILKKALPEKCNLGSVQCISSGTEMVVLETIQRFENMFSQFRLKKNTIRPIYSLAEHTSTLCAFQKGQDPVVMEGKISCGKPLSGVLIKVVDPETCAELSEGEVGEIWVDSESKALGYWEKEVETQKMFEAELDDFSDRVYLRTGDLGFMKHGQLFIVGCRNDMIVTCDRKIHPASIEKKVEQSFRHLRSGRTVAFQHRENNELADLICVAELRAPTSHSQTELSKLSENITATISFDFKVNVSLVVFIQRHTMPCTSCGKKQRSHCKKALLKGALKEVFRWEPTKHPQPHARRSSIQSSKPLVQSPVEIKITEDEVSMELDDGDSFQDSMDRLQASPTLSSRRKSAPPHPKDPDARVKDYHRRSSMMVKRSGFRRTSSDQVHSRRNSFQLLTDMISSAIGKTIQPETNLWEDGFDIHKAAELSKKLESKLGFTIEPQLLSTHKTPLALMAKLQRSLLSMGSPPEVIKDSKSNKKEDGSKTEKGSDLDDFITPMKRDRAFSAESSIAYKRPLLHKRRQPDTLLNLLQNKPGAKVTQKDDIAIVGMACSFPGCSTPAEFWDLLMSKSIVATSLSDTSSGETVSGGFTPSAGIFDHKWFGVSELEASTMDPQHYMLLHSAWECLHNARYVPQTKGREWGVFIGIHTESATHTENLSENSILPVTSTTASTAANRVARLFNFTGPIQSIDTACSSSLSALDSACTYLKAGKCSAALVCGVNTILDIHQLKKTRLLSQDKAACEYMCGEGCGSVLLMPLAQAVKEERRILAVIKATATNNNGALSASLRMPSIEAQTALLKTALSMASLSPNAIDYVEAHSIGNKAGDLVEADAICSVISQSKRESPVVVGGCKANIGHLEAASGIASLIKTVLVLEHGQAPGSVEMDNSFSNKSNISTFPDCKYLKGEKGLCSGIINSFGFCGTNASAILSQYEKLPHMGQVQCQLVFSTLMTSVDKERLNVTLDYLKSEFAAIKEALTSCEEAMQKTINRLRLKVNAEEIPVEVVVFKVYYALVVLLQSLNVEISLIGASDYLGDILALVTAGALNLQSASQFLLTKSSYLTLSQPTKSSQNLRMPILSCTGKLYYPSEWHTEVSRTQYFQQLESVRSQRKSNTAQYVAKMVAMQEAHTLPIVSISVDTYSPLSSLLKEEGVKNSSANCGVFISVSEIVEQDGMKPTKDLNCRTAMHYLREKLLLLRDMSDKMDYDACKDKPMKMADKILATFYQRYPLRALTDNHPPVSGAENGTGVSQRKQSTLSMASSISAGDESGYITLANSAESLNGLVHTNTSDIHTLTSMTISLSLSERPLLNSPSSSKVSYLEEKKWQIVSKIAEEFLGSSKLTTGELANTGLFQLGLNSMQLIQLVDYLMKTYDVDMSISEMIEHETLGEIAKAVVEESSSFTNNAPTSILKTVAESTELNVYPRLTREEYYTIPSMEEIGSSEPLEDGSILFHNFTVGRNGVRIVFQGETDVSSLNLDKLVFIEGQQIAVCNDPIQMKSQNLNKPSLIFFDLRSINDKEKSMELCMSILRSNVALPVNTWKYDGLSRMFVLEVDRFY